MISRVLPLSEWPRLRGLCELGETLDYLPHDAQILVVEREDQIVGVWALLTVHRAEGVWVHPDYRGKTSVARRLWRFLHETAQRVGAWRLETGACDPLIARLLERHGGQRVPVDTYVLPLKGSK